MSLGATRQEWQHADLVLGLGADLLPVVPDPNATPSTGSKVKRFGKIPSAYDREGNAHGLKDWPTRAITPADIERWSKDERLAVCVRASAVRAIDVDITEPELAESIHVLLLSKCPRLRARRTRANSSKFLMPVLLDGKHAKRIIDCGPAGRIEFLADGQQWLFAGSHESGARYVWEGGLPETIESLTLEELDDLWGALKQFEVQHVPGRFSSPGRGAPDAGRSIEATDVGILTEITDAQLEDLRSALGYKPLISAGADNSTWSEIGYALLSLGTLGQALWTEFSAHHALASDENADGIWWDAHITQTPRSDFRHIFTLARRLGWRTLADVDAFPVVDAEPGELVPDAPERPVLRIRAGELDKYAAEAEAILSPDVFTQPTGLVRIGAGTELNDKTINRTPTQRAIIRVTSEYVRRKLTQLATIQKYSKQEKDWIPTDCPKELAINILDQRDWPTLRPLEAISRAPFIRNDGSICTTPGYDESSGVMYIPNAQFPALPAPSRDAALIALDRLMEPFAEFPYKTEAARSTFIAHVLTEAARVAIDSVPMFWYSAPSAGTGKTLLSKVPGIITHGEETSLRPWVDDSEEIRKVLFASLLAGDRSIGFDNVPNGAKVRSPLLCALLTSGQTYKDRKLGASEVIVVKNKATCFASGNNITPVSDMARRSLIVRLDANISARKLRERSFTIEGLELYVKLHRPQFLIDALTIVSSYLAEPSRIGKQPLPSFERWSLLVREPLIWLGLEDPVESQEEETDDELDYTEAAFSALVERTSIGCDREFTSRDIAACTEMAIDSDGALRAALLSAGCSDPYNAGKVGFWLRDKRDVIAGSYKLERYRMLQGTQRWIFRRVGTGLNEDLL